MDQNETVTKSLFCTIFDFFELFVIAMCAVMLCFMFLFRMCSVSGNSMNPTLCNGEKLITSDLFYTPHPGDIIVFHQTSETEDKLNETLIKRVIAVGGSTVKIDYRNSVVTVNDVVVDESYLPEHFAYKNPALGTKTYQVPEGYLFVMGDNRNDSLDSRYPEIGFVDERRVVGKVIFRFTPFEKFGVVE